MWKILLNGSLWAGGSLSALALALYGFLWLPYREPESQKPPLLTILPESEVIPEQDLPLDDYAWVDRDARIVRIPVNVAMKIMIERLPGATENEESGSPPRAIPTDAGSGRFPR